MVYGNSNTHKNEALKWTPFSFTPAETVSSNSAPVRPNSSPKHHHLKATPACLDIPIAPEALCNKVPGFNDLNEQGSWTLRDLITEVLGCSGFWDSEAAAA